MLHTLDGVYDTRWKCWGATLGTLISSIPKYDTKYSQNSYVYISLTYTNITVIRATLVLIQLTISVKLALTYTKWGGVVGGLQGSSVAWLVHDGTI